jgi:hypothetical protein
VRHRSEPVSDKTVATRAARPIFGRRCAGHKSLRRPVGRLADSGVQLAPLDVSHRLNIQMSATAGKRFIQSKKPPSSATLPFRPKKRGNCRFSRSSTRRFNDLARDRPPLDSATIFVLPLSAGRQMKGNKSAEQVETIAKDQQGSTFFFCPIDERVSDKFPSGTARVGQRRPQKEKDESSGEECSRMA